MIIIVIIVINNTHTLKPFFFKSQGAYAYVDKFLRYFNNFVVYCVSQF